MTTSTACKNVMMMSDRSPLFVDAHEGYETRLVEQLRQTLLQANRVAAEVDNAILMHGYRLRLEQENRELRKLAGPEGEAVKVVAATSGDVVVDVVKAVADEMEKRVYASHQEVRGSNFIDAVRQRLKEQARTEPPPVPREFR